MQIITARQCISPEVTVKGFKKVCISTAMDESDDNMLGNGRKMMGMLGMGGWDEGIDCEDGDSDNDW